MRSAASEWQRLKGRRQGLEARWEQYASLTLPRIYTPDNWDENTDSLAFDWSSVGAQAVNHIVNKLMLTMFAPSRPFMRLTATQEFMAKLPSGIEPSMIEDALSMAEIEAAKQMDSIKGLRSKLYLTLGQLVVTGNSLLYTPSNNKEPFRVLGPDAYVVRRTGNGDVKQLIIREVMLFDELQQEVQEAAVAAGGRYRDDSRVEYFRMIVRNGRGGYDYTQAVNTVKLPEQFSGSWTEEALPWRVQTFNLGERNNYGTGLVEDYAGDLKSLSMLSEAQIKGAILSSEFRWLVAPGGSTNIDDLRTSSNGDAIPGVPNEVQLLANSKPGDLAIVKDAAAEYIQRIGRGFLLNSAVTRTAERVNITALVKLF